MASSDGPPSQGETDAAQSAAPSGEEPFPSVDLPKTASPAPSGSSGVPDLTRTDSTPSLDRISLRSHVSIPVVGTFPLGSLRVHKIMDSPRPQRPGGPQHDISDMPPLEDSAADTSASSLSGGDVFLILDLPQNSIVGCDAKAIGTGTSGFQGIRDIPSGSHFLWVSEPNAMSRCGYWFATKTQGHGEVRVKQWDRFNEVLVDPASNFEVRDHRDNVASLYPQLVPYGLAGGDTRGTAGPDAPSPPRGDAGDEDQAQLWRRLTSCISEKLLARVTGKTDVTEWLVDTSDSAAGDSGFPQTRTSQLHQTLVGTTGELNFLFPEGDVDLHTARALREDPDTTADVLRLLDTPGTGVTDVDLLGELQFTFLTGLHLGNLACVEQWWHLLLRVVLRAHELVLRRPGLCRSLLGTFHAQLVYDDKYISSGGPSPAEPEDGGGPRREYGGAAGGSTSVLDMLPGNKRKLRDALTLYKRRLNETLLDLPGGRITEEQGEVGKAFVELEAWFWRFGWDLRTDYVRDKKQDGGEFGAEEDMGYDEDDEYRPVIVDLDEDGREIGLVSFN